MRKIKLSGAALFAAILLSIASQAQQKIEASAANFSIESLKIKRDFTINSQAINKRAKTGKREIVVEATVKTDALNNSARRQTYVRPTKQERFNRYASDAFGVPALIGATFGATFSQIGNDPPEWEKNIGGFGKRFASSYATNAIRNTVSYGISEAFRLDNRFERSGEKNFGKRLKHVFVASYTTRTKTGKRILDFPHFIGTYSAAIIANEAWYPDRYGYKDGLRDGTVSLGVRFGINLLREFVLPK